MHLDGYNITDALSGKSASPRREFCYWNPFVTLRAPKLFNLRSDPFETADHEAMGYEQWWVEHLFVFVPAQQFVGTFLATFKEFPPSQKGGSFSLDQVLQTLQSAPKGGSN